MADDTLELINPIFHNNPGLWPSGMEPFYPLLLSAEQRAIIHSKKTNTAREDEKYLGAHPEVNAIVALILRAVLAARPRSLHEFVAEFMTRPCLKEEIAAYLKDEMNNTVVDLEAESDDDKEPEEDADEGGYQHRVSRVSFQVEKNTTTFFDELSSSLRSSSNKSDNSLNASLTHSTERHDILAARRGSRPNAKLQLARSVSDYYIPTEDTISTKSAAAESVEATFSMSDDGTAFTLSMNKPTDVSAINVVESSDEQIPEKKRSRQRHVDPGPAAVEDTDPTTVASIQDKLENVCSDFRFVNQDESSVYMHVAGIADRRRSVLPTREALQAAIMRSAVLSAHNTSNTAIRERSIHSTPTSRRTSGSALNMDSSQGLSAGLLGMSFGITHLQRTGDDTGSRRTSGGSADVGTPSTMTEKHAAAVAHINAESPPTTSRRQRDSTASSSGSGGKTENDELSAELSRTPSAAQSVMPVMLTKRDSMENDEDEGVTSPENVSLMSTKSLEAEGSRKSKVKVEEDLSTRISVSSAVNSLASLGGGVTASWRNSFASVKSGAAGSLLEQSRNSVASMRSYSIAGEGAKATALSAASVALGPNSLASVRSYSIAGGSLAGGVPSTAMNLPSNVGSRAGSVAGGMQYGTGSSVASVRGRVDHQFMTRQSVFSVASMRSRQTSVTADVEVPDIAQAVIAPNYFSGAYNEWKPKNSIMMRTPSMAARQSTSHQMDNWRENVLSGTAPVVETTRLSRYSIAAPHTASTSTADSEDGHTDARPPASRRSRQLSSNMIAEESTE